MNPLESLANLISGLFQPKKQALATGGTPSPTPDPFVAKGAIKLGPNHYYIPSESNPTPTQTASPIPAPTDLPAAQPTSLADSFSPVDMEAVRKGITKRYGADSPILPNLDLYMQAGQKLPKGMDPLLPIILALRETQGGRYNVGKNNVFNLRNDTGAFQDYPDLQTAILGNLAQGGQSGGMLGLLSGEKPSSHSIYEDYRQDPADLAKLFAHWSPPTDSNGTLPVQVDNYNWIRRHISNADLPNNQ